MASKYRQYNITILFFVIVCVPRILAENTFEKSACFSLMFDGPTKTFEYGNISEQVSINLTCSNKKYIWISSIRYAIPKDSASFCGYDPPKHCHNNRCSCCKMPKFENGTCFQEDTSDKKEDLQRYCSDISRAGYCHFNVSRKLLDDLSLCSLNYNSCIHWDNKRSKINECYFRWVFVKYQCVINGSKSFSEQPTHSFTLQGESTSKGDVTSTLQGESTSKGDVTSTIRYSTLQEGTVIYHAEKSTYQEHSNNWLPYLVVGLVVAAIVIVGLIVFVVKKKSKNKHQSAPKNGAERNGKYVNLRAEACVQQSTCHGGSEQIYNSINDNNLINMKLDLMNESNSSTQVLNGHHTDQITGACCPNHVPGHYLNQVNESCSPTHVLEGYHQDQMNESCSATQVLEGYHPDQINGTCSPEKVLEGCPLGNDRNEIFGNLYSNDVNVSNIYLTTEAAKSLKDQIGNKNLNGDAKYGKSNDETSEKMQESQNNPGKFDVDPTETNLKSVFLDETNDVKHSRSAKENDYLVPQKLLLPSSVMTSEVRLDPIGQEEEINDPLDDETQEKSLVSVKAGANQKVGNVYEEPMKRFDNKMYFNAG